MTPTAGTERDEKIAALEAALEEARGDLEYTLALQEKHVLATRLEVIQECRAAIQRLGTPSERSWGRSYGRAISDADDVLRAIAEEQGEGDPRRLAISQEQEDK